MLLLYFASILRFSCGLWYCHSGTTTTMQISALYLSLASFGYCREIVFPPVLGVDHDVSIQSPFRLDSKIDDDVDLSTDAMGGLTSFAHLPYVPCFAAKTDEVINKYDIAVLGAPFDTGTSYRPGARFGPHGIRDGSRRIRQSSWNMYTKRNAFQEWAKVVDCGDAPLTFIDNTVALKQLVKAHKVSLPGKVAGKNQSVLMSSRSSPAGPPTTPPSPRHPGS